MRLVRILLAVLRSMRSADAWCWRRSLPLSLRRLQPQLPWSAAKTMADLAPVKRAVRPSNA
jgi:hypothetical protein